MRGAGNRQKTSNSFVISKNPETEHTKVLDFAPKVTVSALQNAVSRDARTPQNYLQ